MEESRTEVPNRKIVSRRGFLATMGLGGGAMLLAACQPAPAAQPTTAPAKPAATTAPAAKPTTAPAASPAASPAAQKAPASTSADQELAQLYEAAKAEGTFTFYGSMNLRDSPRIFAAFNETYPDIKPEHNRALGEELVQQMLVESQAGRNVADVIEAVDQDFYLFMRSGLIEPYVGPSTRTYPADFKGSDGLWTSSRVNIDSIGFNTDLMPVAEAPQTFEELTDPKYKGKLMVPADSLSVFTALRNRKFGNSLERTVEFYEKIAAQQPDMHTGGTEMIQFLAAGLNAIYMGAPAIDIERMKPEGAPVEWSKKEAVMEGALTGLAKNAPHPNAAKLFINWYLGPKGQQALANIDRIPAHPEAEVASNLKPRGITWYVTSPETAEHHDENLAAYQRIFGLRAG